MSKYKHTHQKFLHNIRFGEQEVDAGRRGSRRCKRHEADQRDELRMKRRKHQKRRKQSSSQ